MEYVLIEAARIAQEADERYNDQLVASKLEAARLALSHMSRGKPYSILKQRLRNLESHVRPNLDTMTATILVARTDQIVSDAIFFQADTNRRIGLSVRQSVETVLDRVYTLPADKVVAFQSRIDSLTSLLETASSFDEYLAIFQQAKILEIALNNPSAAFLAQDQARDIAV